MHHIRELCPFLSQNKPAPGATEAWTWTVSMPRPALCTLTRTLLSVEDVERRQNGRHILQEPEIVVHHAQVSLELLNIWCSRHLLNDFDFLWHRANAILISLQPQVHYFRGQEHTLSLLQPYTCTFHPLQNTLQCLKMFSTSFPSQQYNISSDVYIGNGHVQCFLTSCEKFQGPMAISWCFEPSQPQRITSGWHTIGKSV